jgi:hypothetical protein
MKMNDAYLVEKKSAVIRSCPGGIMVMDRDHTALGLDNLEAKVVTKRPPTEEECAPCASPGASSNTSNPTPSSMPPPTARSASVPAK